MSKQKSVAAIHDLSGIGKCSLSGAIPVLSAAGVSVSSLPTAVLSTQTGGISNYTYCDLTEEMKLIKSHWKSLGVKFDAVYSGFLGSKEQVDVVTAFVSEFSHKETIYLCDPAMADNGELYSSFNKDFIPWMKKLCLNADIIVPNYTEAFFLLDMDYSPPPYKKDDTELLIRSLAEKYNSRYVVLTGADFDGISVGAAAYDALNDKISYSLRPRINGMFHSTGDLFASSLLGGILNGLSVDKATEIAIDFTVNSIKETVKNCGDSRFGLSFEPCLAEYMKSLEIM